MTLEDETRTVNLIVRPRGLADGFAAPPVKARVLMATGLLQRQYGVAHVIVDRLEDLTTQLPNLRHVSRDFH